MQSSVQVYLKYLTITIIGYLYWFVVVWWSKLYYFFFTLKMFRFGDMKLAGKLNYAALWVWQCSSSESGQPNRGYPFLTQLLQSAKYLHMVIQVFKFLNFTYETSWGLAIGYMLDLSLNFFITPNFKRVLYSFMCHVNVSDQLCFGLECWFTNATLDCMFWVHTIFKKIDIQTFK